MKKRYKKRACENTHRTRKLGSPVNAPTGKVRKKLKFSLLEKQEPVKNKTTSLRNNRP